MGASPHLEQFGIKQLKVTCPKGRFGVDLLPGLPPFHLTVVRCRLKYYWREWSV